MATRLVLVEGSDLLERAKRIEAMVEYSQGGQKTVCFLSGEAFATGKKQLEEAILKVESSLRQSGARIFRLAPGCVCCSSRLIVQTHLARILRFNPPNLLVLELDTQSHVEQVSAWLEAPEWQGWFSSIDAG